MIGRTLGGTYKVLELVGSGGFADVYVGRDVRRSEVVALKVLHPHFARESLPRKLFLDEGRKAQALNDPRVVRVLGSGQDADTYYIAMEFVAGHTLAQIVAKRGPLPTSEAAGYLNQVLQALEVAHAASIFHRDIKPANIMVTPAGRVKVMDFGIAKHAASGTMTMSGEFCGGTPEYMAPEQIAGKNVDGRADLYAVGITLFELLAGRPPFAGDTQWKTLNLQVHAPPPPLRQFRPDAPVELERVIQRALQKDAKNRFQTAREMAAALAGEITVPNVRPPGRFWLPIAAAGLALALAAGLIASSTGRNAQLAAADVPTGTNEAPLHPVPKPPNQPTPSLPERLDEVQRLTTSGQYSLALELLRSLPEGNARVSETLYQAHIRYGSALLGQNDLDGSYAQFGAALSLKPNDAEASNGQKRVILAKNWGIMEAAWGKDDEAAIAALNEIMQLDPSYRDARQKLYALLISKADRLLAAGERDTAFQVLLQALNVGPDGAEAQKRLAMYTPTPTPRPPPVAPIRPPTQQQAPATTQVEQTGPEPGPTRIIPIRTPTPVPIRR